MPEETKDIDINTVVKAKCIVCGRDIMAAEDSWNMGVGELCKACYLKATGQEAKK